MAVNFAKLPDLLHGPPPISGGEYGSASPAGRTTLGNATADQRRLSLGGRSAPPPGLCEPGAHIGRR